MSLYASSGHELGARSDVSPANLRAKLQRVKGPSVGAGKVELTLSVQRLRRQLAHGQLLLCRSRLKQLPSQSPFRRPKRLPDVDEAPYRSLLQSSPLMQGIGQSWRVLLLWQLLFYGPTSLSARPIGSSATDKHNELEETANNADEEKGPGNSSLFAPGQDSPMGTPKSQASVHPAHHPRMLPDIR
ncbi:unnamed protein product, partial [Protopolystoma xenopodis]